MSAEPMAAIMMRLTACGRRGQPLEDERHHDDGQDAGELDDAHAVDAAR